MGRGAHFIQPSYPFDQPSMGLAFLLVCGSLGAAAAYSEQERQMMYDMMIVDQDLEQMTELDLEASPPAAPKPLYFRCTGHAECKGDDTPEAGDMGQYPSHKCVGMCVKLPDLEMLMARSPLNPARTDLQGPDLDPGMPQGFQSCFNKVKKSPPEVAQRSGCCMAGSFNKQGTLGMPTPHSPDQETKGKPKPAWKMIRGCTDVNAANYDPDAVEDSPGNPAICIGCQDPAADNYCAHCSQAGPCNFGTVHAEHLDDNDL